MLWHSGSVVQSPGLLIYSKSKVNAEIHPLKHSSKSNFSFKEEMVLEKANKQTNLPAHQERKPTAAININQCRTSSLKNKCTEVCYLRKTHSTNENCFNVQKNKHKKEWNTDEGIFKINKIPAVSKIMLLELKYWWIEKSKISPGK